MTTKSQPKTQMNPAWYPLLEDLALTCEAVASMPTDHDDDDVGVVPQSAEVSDDAYKIERAYKRAGIINTHVGAGNVVPYAVACHLAGVAVAARAAMKGMKEPRDRVLTDKQKSAKEKLWSLVMSRPGSGLSRELSILIGSEDQTIRLIYSNRLRDAFPDMSWELIAALDVLVGT